MDKETRLQLPYSNASPEEFNCVPHWTAPGIEVGRWVTVYEKNVSWYGGISYLNWTDETVSLYTKIGGKCTTVKLKMEDTISIKINWLK